MGHTREDQIPVSLSLHPVNGSVNLSISCPFLPFPHSLYAPPPSSTPLTYLLKDIWLPLELSCSPSVSACLSSLAIFSPLCRMILSAGQSVSHWVLQRHCAAVLCNSGSIVNGSGASEMHVLCETLIFHFQSLFVYQRFLIGVRM